MDSIGVACLLDSRPTPVCLLDTLIIASQSIIDTFGVRPRLKYRLLALRPLVAELAQMTENCDLIVI